MPDAATPQVHSRCRLNRRALVVAVAAWAAVVAVALGVAALLDDPPAPPVSAVPKGLPPIQLYLNRPLPPSVAAKGTLQAQATEIQRLASATGTAESWVDLGVFSHRLQALQDAALAYRRALAVDPADVEAQVGLALLDAAADRDALARAERALGDLQATHPDDQVVAFNHGMLGVYLRDPAVFTPAFRLATRLGPDTPLGRQAAQLLSVSGRSGP